MEKKWSVIGSWDLTTTYAGYRRVSIGALHVEHRDYKEVDKGEELNNGANLNDYTSLQLWYFI